MKSNPVARANKNRPQVIPNKKKPKRNDLKSELKNIVEIFTANL